MTFALSDATLAVTIVTCTHSPPFRRRPAETGVY